MGEKLYISSVTPNDFTVLIEIWEASVRKTHHFLQEEDIQFLKPLIKNKYFKMVDLICCKDGSGKILGFMGISGDKIEMLFIHPSVCGKGLGKILLMHGIKKFKVNKVDVNEQNLEAVGFYHHLGFQTKSRSETDSLGKSYPLLHLELVNKEIIK